MRFMDPLEREEYMEDVHLRILRVTEDLRAIQRELNCAAMEAPNDPELMEALSEFLNLRRWKCSSRPLTKCDTFFGSMCR